MANGMNMAMLRAMLFGRVPSARLGNDAIDRATGLRHRKKWELKRINKRLASNGLRLLQV